MPAGFIRSAVLGGIASEVTGGKFRNGAATAVFTWALSQGAEAIKTNSSGSNASGIEILENLPDNPEAVYQEGRELAAAQKELNVDESVQFDNRHAFCPETCNTDTIRYRSSAAEGIEFLKNNSDYRLLLGAHWNGQSYIFPGATVSMTITYPVGTAGYRNYFLGSGPSGFVVTGAEKIGRASCRERMYRERYERRR